MARKATVTKSKNTTPIVADETIVKTTPARNSPIPNLASIQSITSSIPAAKEISYDQIAERAYFISISGSGGDETHNWLQAERELRGS
jgi:hypothetical protein